MSIERVLFDVLASEDMIQSRRNINQKWTSEYKSSQSYRPIKKQNKQGQDTKD